MREVRLALISYKPLWDTMKEKSVSTYALINKHGFSARTIYNLKHGKSITLYTLEKLCKILDCQAESIVKFIPDDEPEAK